MIRKTSTVIILTLLLSACCEKEGSWLNTVIKNHAAKLAAAAQLEATINTNSSTLNANAAAIPIENAQNAAVEDTTSEILTIEKIVTKTEEKLTNAEDEEIIKKNNIAVEKLNLNESPTIEPIDHVSEEHVVSKLENSRIDTNSPNLTNEIDEPLTIQGTTATDIHVEKSEIKPVDTNKTAAVIDQRPPPIQAEETAEQPAQTEQKTVAILEPAKHQEMSTNTHEDTLELIEQDSGESQIEVVLSKSLQETVDEENYIDTQLSLNNEDEIQTIIDDKEKKLSELISLFNEEDNTAIEQFIEQAKAENKNQIDESLADRNQRLLELLSKDIKQQAQKPNSKISQQSLELLNEILSD